MKPLPPLIALDKAKLARLVADGQLIPVLNNTKWSELIEEMLGGAELKPQFRCRSVFAPPGYMTEWDGEWYHHIHPVAELEWVDLRATSEDWLRQALRKHNIPFSIEQGVLRVWGYVRPAAWPCWV